MTLLDPSASVELATFILIGIVLLKYSGFKEKIEAGLGFAVAGVMFLYLNAATEVGVWTLGGLASAQYALSLIWQVIAWILLLVAAFFVARDLVQFK